MERAGRLEEIADAVVFVASNKASFITGQIIAVNGGKTAMKRHAHLNPARRTIG